MNKELGDLKDLTKKMNNRNYQMPHEYFIALEEMINNMAIRIDLLTRVVGFIEEDEIKETLRKIDKEIARKKDLGIVDELRTEEIPEEKLRRDLGWDKTE